MITYIIFLIYEYIYIYVYTCAQNRESERRPNWGAGTRRSSAAHPAAGSLASGGPPSCSWARPVCICCLMYWCCCVVVIALCICCFVRLCCCRVYGFCVSCCHVVELVLRPFLTWGPHRETPAPVIISGKFKLDLSKCKSLLNTHKTVREICGNL